MYVLYVVNCNRGGDPLSGSLGTIISMQECLLCLLMNICSALLILQLFKIDFIIYNGNNFSHI